MVETVVIGTEDNREGVDRGTIILPQPRSVEFVERASFRYCSRRARMNFFTFSSFYSIREAFPTGSCARTAVNRESPTEFSNFVKDFCRTQVGNLDSSSSTHIATSYDDTTEGAVHIFQDENGQWMSYTFDERGSGVAVNLGTTLTRRKDAPLNPIEEHHKAASGNNLR